MSEESFNKAVVEAMEFLLKNDIWKKSELAQLGIIFTFFNRSIELAQIGKEAFKRLAKK